MSSVDEKVYLDDVLDKIKRTIEEGGKSDANKENDDVFELTNAILERNSPDEALNYGAIDNGNQDLISEHVQNFTRKLNLLTREHHIVSEKEVQALFAEMLRPYLKSWLNNNLKDIAKEVLSAEIRKLFNKGAL